MDIRKLAVAETKVLHLIGPDKKPLFGEDGMPMTATIYGPGSKQYMKAQSANVNRTMDQLARGDDVEVTHDQKAKFLAECTKEFSSNIEYEGLKGEALFHAVYADYTIGYIAEQVLKSVGEWKGFMKGSIEA